MATSSSAGDVQNTLGSSAASANTAPPNIGTAAPIAPGPPVANKPARSRAAQGSTVEAVYGRRKVKHYSVNDSDLAQLSTFGGLASASFALGTLLVGMSSDLIKGLVANGFAPPAPATVSEASWVGAQWGFLITGGIFTVAGVVLLVTRHSKASQIKEETVFRD